MSFASTCFSSFARVSARFVRSHAFAVVAGCGLIQAILAPVPAWAATAKPVISYSPNSDVFILGSVVSPINPTNSGGAATSWAITPALPPGLAFSTATGQIAGTPTALSLITTYSITASNAGGTSTPATLKITVNDVVPNLTYSPSAAVFTKGLAITPLVPANGGGAVVTWSITPALSTGLAFSASTGTISGTPTALKATTAYTVKGTNSGGSATAVVTLTVNDLAPAVSYSPATYTFTKGTAIATINPASTGGAVVSWSVAPALPAGLVLAATTGKITGTPTGVSAAASYTITATNTGGSTTAGLTLTVNDKLPAFTFTPATDTYTVNTPIAALVPASTGGTVLGWSVSPALPSGLVLDPSSGQITGMPTAPKAQATYTVTGTNSGGSSTYALKFTVNDIAPTLSYSPSAAAFTKGVAITPMVPVTGGGAVVTWSITPALSAGLAFSTSTGTITGTPTALLVATSYTVKATNTGGSVSAVVNLAVHDLAPAISYTPTTYTFTKGTSVGTITPASTGGAVVAWTVAPALPAGLALAATTGKITGTPTTLSAATICTVTATNSGGTATAALTLSVKDKLPAFTYAPATDTYTLNTAIAALVPASTGGTVLSWSVAPALPAGLALDPASGQITGAPTAVKAQATYTVTGANATGSGTYAIKITVNALKPVIAYSPSSAVFTKGVAITTLKPTSTGGAIATWSISPALPAGVVISPSTGWISGTPAVLSGMAAYTVTAQNGVGTGTAALTFTVNDLSPAFAYNPAAATFTLGLAAGPVLPVSTGGTVVSWSIAPGLPAGLALDPSSGQISGIPAAQSPATAYTVTGTNTGGTASSVLTLTVNPPAPAIPVIGVAGTVTAGSPGLTASTPDQGPWMNYAWTVANGTLTGGQGTPAITFTAGQAGPLMITVIAADAAGRATATAPVTVVAAPIGDLQTTVQAQPNEGPLTAQAPAIQGLTYLWTSPDLNLAGDPTGNAIAWTAPAAPGAYHLSLNTQNALGVSATATRSITVASGAWLPRPQSGARFNHSSVVLPSGLILLAGGHLGLSTLASTELYDQATGLWTRAGNLLAAREGHTATVLANGTVLVAGGSSNGVPMAACEIYDPGTGAWTATAPMLTARIAHTASLLPGGQVLVAGGEDPTLTPLASAELFDPATGTWAAVADMNSAHAFHTANTLVTGPNAGMVLVAGGSDGVNVGIPIAEIFDPGQGLWSLTANLNTPRSGHSATLLADGRVMATGGQENTASVSQTDVYDPIAGTWTNVRVMNTPRMNHTATLLADGTVLVTGGLSWGNIVGTAETFDPLSGSWSQAGNLQTARTLHSAILLTQGPSAGKVLILDGDSPSHYLPAEELFDPAARAWSQVQYHGAIRYAHTATRLPSGQILVAGGNSQLNPPFNAPGALTSADLYDPANNRWLPTGSLTVSRYGAQATVLTTGPQAGQVLVAAGFSTMGALTTNTAELYDPVAGTWSMTGSMAGDRYNHSLVTLPSGMVLVIGGASTWGPPQGISVEAYDPNAGTWSLLAPLNTARTNQVAVLLNTGKILVAGGDSGPGGGYFASAELYDPLAGTWAYTGSMAAARSNASATLLPDGTVLVAGGQDSTGPLASAEIYNPASGAWSPAAPLGTARFGQQAALLPNGQVLVTAGRGVGGILGSSELFNPFNGTWAPSGGLGTARYGHTATPLADGRIAVLGGISAPDPATGASPFVLTSGEEFEGSAPSLQVTAITPPVPAVNAGGAVAFTASLAGGSNLAVTWTASGGTIDPTGLWTAPAVAGPVTITATSVADPTQSASTVATVVPLPVIGSFTATPGNLVVTGPGSSLSFAYAGGTGALDQGIGPVPSGVPVTVTPAATTTYTLTVTNALGATVSAQCTVTVAMVGQSFAIPDVTSPGATLPLVLNAIPGGTFTMGSPATDPDLGSNEVPQMQITISPFYMGRFPVTQGLWQAVMGNNPANFTVANGGATVDDLTRPVEQVSFNDVIANATGFLDRLNAATQATRPAGMVFRLPTEAEWEYADRAGTATRYYWGDDLNNTDVYNNGWFSGNSNNSTQPVGQKAANPFGLYDMNGNVFQWCQDWMDAYPGGTWTDPAGPGLATPYRILRGGSFNFPATQLRSAQRGWNTPDARTIFFGFRVVLAAPRPVNLTFAIPDQTSPGVTVPLVMNSLNGGTFTMGSPFTEAGRNDNESPQQTVTVSPFYLGRFAVTQAQWQAVMGSNPSKFSMAGGFSATDDLTRPVDSVTYTAITTPVTGFLDQLNAATAATRPAGMSFRLATEAEREYADRAGTTTRFYWGDDPTGNLAFNYAWFSGNSSSATQPVGQKLPNAFGLFDINGNVYEWCQDWMGPYPGGILTDPQGPADTGWGRTLRGGCIYHPVESLRSAMRGSNGPDATAEFFGLRVVLATTYTAPAVTVPPQGLAVQPGDPASFSATVTGYPVPTLQWQRSNDGGATWADLPGVTSAGFSFTTTTADNGAQFHLVVTNSVGSITSSSAILSVGWLIAAPSGLSYPANPVVAQIGTPLMPDVPAGTGGPVSAFSVSPALPAGLALNTNTGILSGTPTAITPAASYTVTASNVAGSTSSSLSIAVNDLPPANLAYPVTTATFTTGNPILADSPSVGGGAVVSFAVNPALPSGLSLNPGTGVIFGVPTQITAQGTYTVTAANSGGIASTGLTFTVVPPGPSISSEPASTSAALGGTATFSVTASGATTLSYQWQKGGSNIPGAIASSYTTPALGLGDNGTVYHVVVTDGYGTQDTSTDASLTIIQGAFAATASLGTARDSHTATLLPNGKVLVVGGISITFGKLASAELYDPIAQTYTSTGALTTARYNHSATLLSNGKVLVAGGYGTNGYLTSAELYDPGTGTFAPTGSMGTARWDMTSTLLPNGKVLITGGNGYTGTTASAELYDPATGAFTATGSMGTNRYNHTATLLSNGKVLVTGGYGTSGYLAVAELYDPGTGTFTATGSMSWGRDSHAATVLPDGRVLVAGGYGGSGYLASVELFDPATGTFATTGSLGTARYSFASVLLPDGKVLVAGGNSGSAYLASAELYDPGTGTFAPTGPMARGRYAFSATLLPTGKVLVAGGDGNGYAMANSELYDPQDPSPGLYTATGSMASIREWHTATLLPDGLVLVAGGYDGAGNSLASAELEDPTAGTFSPTGSMGTSRAWHAATLLPNGKVLIAGGTTTTTNVTLASAELFDPAARTFAPRANNVETETLHSSQLWWAWKELE